MKKIFLLAILLVGFYGQSQIYIGYARHGKKTTAEIAAIDVSNTNYIYTAYDTNLGYEIINSGAGWGARYIASGVVEIDPNSPTANITFAVGTTEELDAMPTPATIEFATDADIASDGYVEDIAVTGTDTKTITLTRNGLPPISTNFTDQGTGGAADGNDYLTTVTESLGVLTFGVQNQTNPTWGIDAYLSGKNYSIGSHTTNTNDYMTSVTESLGVLTFNVQNQTNPTFDLDTYLGTKNYSTGAHTTDTQLTQEQVQDYVGSMVAGNTENGIDVTYDDANNEFDFDVVQTTTFNAVLTDAGAGATYTHNTSTASLIKIGKMVFIRLSIVNTSTSGTPTANLRITGIPSGWRPNTKYLFNAEIFGSDKTFYSIQAVTASGQDYIDFHTQDALDGSNHSTFSGVTISGSGYIYINGTYEID